MSEFEVAIKIAGKLDKSLQTSVSSAQKMLGSLGKGGLSSAFNRYRKCNGKYRKSAHHRSHDAGNRARCHIREGVRIR